MSKESKNALGLIDVPSPFSPPQELREFLKRLELLPDGPSKTQARIAAKRNLRRSERVHAAVAARKS